MIFDLRVRDVFFLAIYLKHSELKEVSYFIVLELLLDGSIDRVLRVIGKDRERPFFLKRREPLS